MLLYRPNFCCGCGEKILRKEWNLFTSRRFCESCAEENKKFDLLPRFAAGGGLVAVIFSAGVFLGGNRAAPEPSAPLRLSSPVSADVAPQRQARVPEPVAAVPKPVDADLPAGVQPQAQASEPENLRPASSTRSEAVYYCGALTKKGTACTRRVKTKGQRCWQHIGMEAVADVK